MDDIFVYMTDLPPKVKALVTPCLDGYTVYIDEKLDPYERRIVYEHEIRHINNNDFSKDNVQFIESENNINKEG